MEAYMPPHGAWSTLAAATAQESVLATALPVQVQQMQEICADVAGLETRLGPYEQGRKPAAQALEQVFNVAAHAAANMVASEPVVAALTSERLAHQTAGQPPAGTARQRRKLWELPSGWHCALIGSCLNAADLRRLMPRGSGGVADSGETSDYGLHSYIVNHCSTRNSLTESIQRLLNRRHAVMLRRFAQLHSGESVLQAWQQEFARGNIAGSLWAAWTHGEVDEYVGSLIYGDLHMLAHQLCAQGQAHSAQFTALEGQLEEQRALVRQLRHDLTGARNEHASRLAELTQRLTQADARCLTLQAQLQEARPQPQVAQQMQRLEARNALLDERLVALGLRNQAQQLRITELEHELARLRNAAPRKAADVGVCSSPDAAESGLDATLEPVELMLKTPCPSSPTALNRFATSSATRALHLAGRRILCVGGRPGVIEHYRRLVESSAGCFMHHDGGQEDNEHRLEASVTGADVVFCQVAYVSHQTYWRIKELCKQRGLPCIFQKSAGVTAFARDLARLADGTSNSPDGALVSPAWCESRSVLMSTAVAS